MKRKKIKSFIFGLTMLLAMMILFCFQPINAKASVPKLNKTKITLLSKKKAVLKVTNTKKKVKWSSSDFRVASVNSKGKVTAKKKGIAQITAKIGKKKLTCKVTVKKYYTMKESYKSLVRYLKKRYKKWKYVSFESEAMKWRGKYLFTIRYQGGNTANVLVGNVEVEPYTGKAIFINEWTGEKRVWKIF